MAETRKQDGGPMAEITPDKRERTVKDIRGDWDLSVLYEDEQRRADFKSGFRYGIIAAAELAGTFDRQTTLKYRLEDIILCKFNVTTRKKPRKKGGRQ